MMKQYLIERDCKTSSWDLPNLVPTSTTGMPGAKCCSSGTHWNVSIQIRKYKRNQHDMSSIGPERLVPPFWFRIRY